MKLRTVVRLRASCMCATLCMLGAPLAGAVYAQVIDYDPGRSGELRPCDDHRYRGRQADARACYDRLLQSDSELVRAEAAWALGDLRGANERFRSLVRERSQDVQARVRWGRLFVQTYQYDEAARLFQEALEIAPQDTQAALGLARVYAERFEGQAAPLLAQVLRREQDSVEAHLLGAGMALEENRVQAAEAALERAERALERRQLPPLEALALRAALQSLRERSPQPWIERALAYNPRYGAVYEQLAHFEIMRRRYHEATRLLQRAVELQPDLWSAHAELGANLLRLGEIERAREHFLIAYSGDPYSPTTVNSLRLLDRRDEFELSSAASSVGGAPVEVRLRLHRSEAGVLRPYVLDLVRRSIETFSGRYGFRLREPVTVELYPDHDDFAVRVAALPGIGLLGVTFGYVVAMDSPSGRPGGEFHWGSTLWHEMAHVFTLESTAHRVPRWLSEGISVFEEWRTGPTPGVVVPPEAIAALRESRLLPVSELDSGFIRPSYPGQVQVSYVQAGLVCLFIEERFGFEHLAALLRQFQERVETAAAIEAVFHMPAAEFDQGFLGFARQRYATLLAEGEDWERAYRAAGEASARERWADVIEPARRAVQLYPEHVGPQSPHLLLANALERLGKRAEALDAMRSYRAAGGWDPAALRQLAQWLDEAGQAAEATQLLQSLNYSQPMDAANHAALGERLLVANRPAESLQEFQALLALSAHDPAPAQFGAARALRALGERAASRRQLLDALAAAPDYRPAQKMLLEIVEERERNE